ncbi:hypothetical protein Q8A67_001444 [Cirrhinus molitorella]|uniref:Uncharacterized protein n=1 Tax=Cirrhinus molitorella TaxID=172907 RepID=A0AA88QHN7_9TELE|nr:hypothetical protein Q8A67_001444 [Cirrhinus molitorella]
MKASDVCFLKEFPVSMERVQISQPDPQTPSGALIHVPRYLGNLPFRVWKKMQHIVQNTPVILDPNTANPWLVLFTQQEEEIPQQIEVMFGEEVLKYSIILQDQGTMVTYVTQETFLVEFLVQLLEYVVVLLV